MKLFKFENHNIIISEEALAIRAFSRIWKKDRSADKNKAIAELSYLFFMYDPRSDYMYIIDPEERHEEICKGLGLVDFKKDVNFKEAEKIYEECTQTVYHTLLRDSRGAIDRLSSFLRIVDFTLLDDNGKVVYDVAKIVSALDKVPRILAAYREVEEEMNKELNSVSRMRGGREKSILEDGFNNY